MKDVRIEIQGKTLFFGRSGTMDYIKEVVKTDPLKWMNEMYQNRVRLVAELQWEITMITDEVLPFAYAGLNLQLDYEEKDNISVQKVYKWLHLLTYDDKAKIINAITEFLSDNNEPSKNGQAEPGELITQPVS